MRISTPRSHRPTAGARALVHAVLPLSLLAAAACADRITGDPVAIPTPALRAERAALAAVPPAQTLQRGIDCGCARVGGYVDPAPGKTIGTGREVRSPRNVYQAGAIATGSTITLHVTRGGATLVKDFTGLPTNAGWTFSPDDDRLLVRYTTGTAPDQVQHILLHDLSAAGTPIVTQLHTSEPITRMLFSPHGRHLVMNRIAGVGLSFITIEDAKVGTLQFFREMHWDPFGTPGFGFSPDTADRTFVYNDGPGPNALGWTMLNLGKSAWDAGVYGALLPTGGWWKFSPCGDVIAEAIPDPARIAVKLVRTLDGSDVDGAARSFPRSTLSVRATLADHVPTSGGVDQPRLAANGASTACPAIPSLASLTLSPTSVRGGGTATCTVTLSGPAPAAGVYVALQTSDYRVADVPDVVTFPAGSTSATFVVQTSAVGGITPATISGTLVTTRSAVLTVMPAPRVTLGPSSLGFGTQQVGSTSGAQTATLTNVGAVPATLAAIATSGDFARSTTCPLAPATLAVGASCTIGVTFAPTASGARAGQLTVSSDASGSPHAVALSGTGTIPIASVSPASLGFGSLRVGTTTTIGKTTTLTNVGTAPLVVASTSVIGPNPIDFGISTDGCTGVTLSPGASCSVKIGFDPAAAGTRSATLRIAHNAAGGASLVSLTGTGVAGPGEIP